MSGIERIRSEHVQDGDPGDPHCAMCSDASYPTWPCDAAILLALLAEREAEIARLVEALLSDCPTVEGDRDHPCWCDAGALNHLQDCWQKRAALAARGG